MEGQDESRDDYRDLGERFDPGRIDVPRALLVALTLAVVVGLGVAASTSTAAFGTFNPAWDGASDFQEAVDNDPETEAIHLTDAGRYDDLSGEGSVAFVVAPEEPYTTEEAAAVRRYVERGGTLVVMDNWGETSNKLLGAVGADSHLDGRLLEDESSNHQGPVMPVATGVADHPLTAGVDQLTLNYATAVDPGENATILVETSGLATISEYDTDSATGSVGSHPVATVETVGSENTTDENATANGAASENATGRVVVVGDPSLTINAMYEEPDNAAFLSALTADTDRVVFDHAHADPVPPLAAVVLAVRDTPLLGTLVGLGAIGAIAAWADPRVQAGVGALATRLVRTFPAPIGDNGRMGDDGQAASVTPGLSDDERAAVIRRRHPEWDDQRIRRVIGALNRSRSQRSDE